LSYEPDNKIILPVSWDEDAAGNTQQQIWRLNSDGSRDATFFDDGNNPIEGGAMTIDRNFRLIFVADVVKNVIDSYGNPDIAYLTTEEAILLGPMQHLEPPVPPAAMRWKRRFPKDLARLRDGAR